MDPSDDSIADALMRLAHARAPDRTFCPSEVARALSPEWRALMPRVRAVAAALPPIVATQKGAPVDPVTARGPIRLALRTGLS